MIEKKVHPRTTRILRVGSCVILLCLAIIHCDSSWSEGISRSLRSIDTHYFEQGHVGVWTESYPTTSVDYYVRATAHAVTDTYIIPENSILFTLPTLECPENALQGVKEDAPPADMFYDVMSVLKYAFYYKDLVLKVDGVPKNFTTNIQVMLPGDATECMGPNGEPYDRIRVLESLGIGVKIIGSPIDKEDVSSPTLKNYVDTDVGIKDLIKLRAFNETEYSVVVLIDYTVLPMYRLDNVLENFINSDSVVALSMDYTPQGMEPAFDSHGVNTGFALIKPSEQEFNAIVSLYKTSQYDTINGWGSPGGAIGPGRFPGAMGTSGILKYRYPYSDFFDTKRAKLLQKCFYNNDYEHHLDSQGRCRDGANICGPCETLAQSAAVARLNDRVCGKPFNCPDLSHLKETGCEKFHRRWFELRAEYEENHFFSPRKAIRNGTFQEHIFLGYCSEEGPEGYEKLIPDAESGPLPIPEPKTIPPGQRCPNTCNPGQYLTQTCQCTADECEACPEGTRCQKADNDVPAMCIDCKCGFCDLQGNACCDFNGVKSCKSATSNKECLLQNGHFPGWPGIGTVCSDVKMHAAAVPTGCGCQPNELTPCTYDANSAGYDKCFIVTANEIILPVKTPAADACKTCLDTCGACVSGDGQASADAMMTCLVKTMGSDSCRSSCASVCKH